MSHKTKRISSYKKLLPFLVVILFAGVGVFLLLSTNSQAPYVANETESGTLSGSASKQTDTNASNGNFIKFSSSLNSLAQILHDMQAPHEGIPHGVPSSYSWYDCPVLGSPTPPSGMTAMTAWGQTYADSTTTEPSNVRIEIKNMEGYVWSNSQQKWL